MPESIGEHDGLIASDRSFAFNEQTTVRDASPQQPQQRRRAGDAAYTRRHAPRFDRAGGEVVHRLILDRRDMDSAIVEVRCRTDPTEARGVHAGILVRHEIDAIRLRNIERMEQCGVHSGEHRGVSAQANGECHDRRRGESAILAQRSPRHADVPGAVIQRHGSRQTSESSSPLVGSAGRHGRRKVARKMKPGRNLRDRRAPRVFI